MQTKLSKALRDPREGCKALCYALLAFAFIAFLPQQVHVLISETDSLPQHYFLQLLRKRPQKGDYTVIYSPWYQGHIIKQIIGVEGDVVRVDKAGALWVNERCVGTPASRASDGRALRSLKAQIIPQGYVFLGSEHLRGFDSRYQELGLVSTLRLEGRVIPLGWGS